VAEVAAMIGKPLMPWQRYVVDVALEIDPASGRLAYREVVVTVPRQSGKTTLILPLHSWRALAFPAITGQAQRIMYGAQSGVEALEKWEDEHLPLLNNSVLSDQYTVRKANGRQAILWNNGSIQGLLAGTEKAGHGKTLDLGIQDEAFALVDGRAEQSIKPAMITRTSPQYWITSTAGTAKSLYLLDKNDVGRTAVENGVDTGLAYFEWRADLDADPADPATWFSCMPSLGVLPNVTVEVIRAEYLSMKKAEFRRAYLNIADTETELESIIPEDRWRASLDPTSVVDHSRRVAIAVDTNPERSATSIAIAGWRVDGRAHVEIIDHRPGTGWVPQRIRELKARWNPVAVVIDPAGPAASVIPDLEQVTAAGKTPFEVIKPNVREAAQAAGDFYDGIMERDDVRHTGQIQLDTAVAAAQKRPLGDAWAWARASTSSDISPLVAVTLARWASVKWGALRSNRLVDNLW
jgi:phage terminase large subunit-like protein